MLVLSRGLGDTLVIGDDVRVTITEIQGQRIKLSIQAPDGVRIVRGEIHESESEQGTA